MWYLDYKMFGWYFICSGKLLGGVKLESDIFWFMFYKKFLVVELDKYFEVLMLFLFVCYLSFGSFSCFDFSLGIV